jgi:hypothetical protein
VVEVLEEVDGIDAEPLDVFEGPERALGLVDRVGVSVPADPLEGRPGEERDLQPVGHPPDESLDPLFLPRLDRDDRKARVDEESQLLLEIHGATASYFFALIPSFLISSSTSSAPSL